MAFSFTATNFIKDPHSSQSTFVFSCTRLQSSLRCCHEAFVLQRHIKSHSFHNFVFLLGSHIHKFWWRPEMLHISIHHTHHSYNNTMTTLPHTKHITIHNSLTLSAHLQVIPSRLSFLTPASFNISKTPVVCYQYHPSYLE